MVGGRAINFSSTLLLEAEETCRASKCCSAVLLRGSLLLIELESWKKNERKCAALTRESSPLPYIFLSPYLSLSLSLCLSLILLQSIVKSKAVHLLMVRIVSLSLSRPIGIDTSFLTWINDACHRGLCLFVLLAFTLWPCQNILLEALTCRLIARMPSASPGVCSIKHVRALILDILYSKMHRREVHICVH